MKQNLQVKKSLEIIADFLECEVCLEKPLMLKKEILSILRRNKTKILKEIFFKFPNKGATIIFLLSDSHLCLHTWPEKALVNVDLFLCNYKKDNSKKVEDIFKGIKGFFVPTRIKIKRIQRLT